ncbi:MAG: hypothetical protein K6U74_07945, partial [Firmicutes bacterium]|nr:hypothetical protein [Bacillota bacterium]
MTASVLPAGAADGSLFRVQADRQVNDKLDKNAFLQLLVAQLRYQDPFQTQNAETFLNQMVQFTTLEQIGNIAQVLGRL